MNDLLYRKATTFMPGEEAIPRVRVLGATALGFLLQAIADDSADTVVSIDEDAFITHPERLVELINKVRDEGIVMCGMPDGGVCPHRPFNPKSINPYFAILDSKTLRSVIANAGYEEQDLESESLLRGHPKGLLRHRFQMGFHESFDPLFVWISENFPTLYLDADEHSDGLTSVLKDGHGRPFLNHTWFTREYMRDPFHTRRINSIIEESSHVNPTGEGVSRVERFLTELRLIEYNIAKRIYIRLKMRYKLV